MHGCQWGIRTLSDAEISSTKKPSLSKPKNKNFISLSKLNYRSFTWAKQQWHNDYFRPLEWLKKKSKNKNILVTFKKFFMAISHEFFFLFFLEGKSTRIFIHIIFLFSIYSADLVVLCFFYKAVEALLFFWKRFGGKTKMENKTVIKEKNLKVTLFCFNF